MHCTQSNVRSLGTESEGIYLLHGRTKIMNKPLLLTVPNLLRIEIFGVVDNFSCPRECENYIDVYL